MITRLTLLLLALVSLSCAARHAGPKKTAEKESPTDFWKPNRLYLKATPHERLHVEVDAVAGCEPTRQELEVLGKMLQRYCDKPEGIHIRQNDVISREDARGLSRRELARGWLNGPRPEDKAPAYLYVLFYDGRLGSSKDAAKANPHTELLPYPAAIFVNRGYRPLWARWVRDELIQHEAGHVLGLADRPQQAEGLHCTEKDCLMAANIAIHIGRLLTWRDPVTQKALCEHCTRQLQEAAKQPPLRNLRFVGPVLMRQEKGYRVLSLPGATALVIGESDDDIAENFLHQERARKTQPGDHPDDGFCYGWIDESAAKERTKLRTILERARCDPYVRVREVAELLHNKAFP